MINVPNYVENEEAYIAAAYSRIAANARKTTDKRAREDAEFAKVYGAIMDRGFEKPESTFFGSLYATYQKYGKWSDKQIAAVASILEKEVARKAEMRERDANSVHIGTVGKRETFRLTLTGTYEAETMYGLQRVHFMKDEAGNVVIYKGTKWLEMAKGDIANVAASVKYHGERDGIKQTFITRAKVI